MSRDTHTDRAQLQQLSWMFFSAIRRMSRNLERHSHDLEKEFGLTVPQLNVLWAVGSSGRAPIGQIAERISLSSATLTSIVDRLEQHDLVTRERSTTDKRQVFVSLTEGGRRVLDRVPQPFHDCFVERLARLERWQQTELLSAVQHVASMMDPEVPTHEPQSTTIAD